MTLGAALRRVSQFQDKWEDFVLSQPRLAGSKSATLATQEQNLVLFQRRVAFLQRFKEA